MLTGVYAYSYLNDLTLEREKKTCVLNYFKFNLNKTQLNA